MLLTFTVTPVGAEAVQEQVLIEADGGVDYDMEHNITTATKKVKLTRGELIIYADRMVYDGNTGVVEAYDNVRLNNKQGDYLTDHLTYNVFTSTGNLEDFRATLKGTSRDFHLKGNELEMSPDSSKIAKVGITRCPKPNPDYVIKASRVKIIGTKVQLKHVVVKIKGIPVFYLPVLSFYTNLKMPDMQLAYSKTDGIRAKFDFMLLASPTSELIFKGDVSSKGVDSVAGMGYANRWGRSRNQVDVLYNFDGWWKLADVYTYETDLLLLTTDGYREFSETKNSQLSVGLTRKYWQTGIGEWQLGAYVRKVSAFNPNILDQAEAEYGGTYSGVQLDYRPVSNVKLSYLRINSHTEADYQDLMEDFGVGDNFLYEVGLPLNQDLKLSFNGTYNASESKWYHQIYSVTKVGCCLSPTVSYDSADDSWEVKAGFRF
ncbi:MAG TPA: OstA-like protein [Bacillota bacterium]|nr:OstA-like protein [Bacillota bacterium]